MRRGWRSPGSTTSTGGAPRWSSATPANFSYPTQWFVRSAPFAAVCPAPFFDTEFTAAAGAALTLRYDIAIADGALDAAACARLAERAAARDLLPAEE